MKIRKMEASDHDQVLAMMRVFYDSPAVFFQVPLDIIERDIADAVSDMPLLDGFIFEAEDGQTAGYAMTAMCYATEFGGLCVWLEDLYLKEEFRGQGLGQSFFKFMEEEYPQAVRFKLEVELENVTAIETYKKAGYQASPYLVMTKEM